MHAPRAELDEGYHAEICQEERHCKSEQQQGPTVLALTVLTPEFVKALVVSLRRGIGSLKKWLEASILLEQRNHDESSCNHGQHRGSDNDRCTAGKKHHDAPRLCLWNAQLHLTQRTNSAAQRCAPRQRVSVQCVQLMQS